MIRPSSKGHSHLNISWKFYENVIVHIDVKEGPKNNADTISNKLTIGGAPYDSLDQILENYITKCNNLMNEVMGHKKFIN